MQLEPTYTYAAYVTRIVDGDTLDVSIDLGFKVWVKERVRLFMVNTPETYGVKKESEEYQRGMAAKEFVEDWLGQSPDRRVILRSVDGKPLGQGKYGRWLAEVERASDGASLNQALLESGHAESVTY